MDQGSEPLNFGDDDVPPLEDLSEFVEKAKALRSRSEESTTAAPGRGEDGTQANTGSSRTTSSNHHNGSAPVKKNTPSASSFGGFKSGFLFENSSQKKLASKSKVNGSNTGVPSNSSAKRPVAEATNSGKDSPKNSTDDIPFLKPKERQTSKGMEFPEVQEAMKEAYPLLRSQDWVTDDLLARIEKHPLLSKVFQDPNLSRVLVEFQSNPQKVMAASRENPEIQRFLQEFCSLMGDHFTALADKEEGVGSGGGVSSTEPLISEATTSGPEEAEIEAVLQRPNVQRVLADPAIKRLIMTLKSDPDAAQRIVQSAGPELRQKVKVLIDNGLLGIQRL